MSDTPRDPVVDLLRAIRGDIAEVRAALGRVRGALGALEARSAGLSRRVDRLGGDLGLIRRHVDMGAV